MLFSPAARPAGRGTAVGEVWGVDDLMRKCRRVVGRPRGGRAVSPAGGAVTVLPARPAPPCGTELRPAQRRWGSPHAYERPPARVRGWGRAGGSGGAALAETAGSSGKGDPGARDTERNREQ